jgi:hypothetical protein
MKKFTSYPKLVTVLFITLITIFAGCTTDEPITTVEADQTLPPAGTLLFKDDFSNTNSGWSKQITQEVQRDYGDGEYFIKLNKFNWMYWVWNHMTGTFDNFILNADARLINSEDSNFYGLIFRHKDDNNFYCFLVKGDWSCFAGKKVNGVLTPLLDWAEIPINKESTGNNHLTVLCKGNQIKLYINGQYLVTIKDTSFSDGHVGIIAGAPQSTTVHAVFDNFSMYTIR